MLGMCSMTGGYRIDPGLPPPGAPGQWLGFNAEGWAFVLRWDAKNNCWVGTGWANDPLYGVTPIAIAAITDKANHFTHHAKMPGIEP